MTEKQRIFAELYVKTGNIAKSLEAAGYKKNYNMSKYLLEKTEIKEYITKMQLKIADNARKKVLINREIVLEKCLDVVDDKSEKASDRLKAIDIINKMLGFYAPTEINQNVNVSTDLQRARQRLIKYAGSGEIATEDTKNLQIPGVSDKTILLD